MEKRTRAYVASGFIVLVFLLVQLGALALVEPFKAAGFQTVEDPQDPTNSLLYVVAILVATAFMLAAIKLDVDALIRGFVVFASVYLSWFVFQVVVPNLVPVGGFNALAAAAALGLGVALYVYPEWYVIDSAGIVMGAGGAGLFGISFGILPAILLLAVLAVYDAISVYGTEHMLALASGVMDLKVPIVLVVPLTLSYSYLDAEMPDPTGEAEDGAVAEVDAETGDDGPDPEPAETPVADGDGTDPGPGDPESDSDTDTDSEVDTDSDTDSEVDTDVPDPIDRDALFIGLGDAVIPTVLVASAAFFAPPSVPSLGVPGIALTLPAVTAMAGTTVGLVVLLRMVLAGRPHAGLPLLNGGAIGGYLVGALASGIPLLEAVGLAQYL